MIRSFPKFLYSFIAKVVEVTFCWNSLPRPPFTLVPRPSSLDEGLGMRLFLHACMRSIASWLPQHSWWGLVLPSCILHGGRLVNMWTCMPFFSVRCSSLNACSWIRLSPVLLPLLMYSIDSKNRWRIFNSLERINSEIPPSCENMWSNYVPVTPHTDHNPH